jgi:ribosomal protein S18 acetylase RimI-like enzyme
LIRDFEAKDIEQLNKLLKSLETKSLIGELNQINQRTSKVIVYERDNQLKGLAYTTNCFTESGDNEAQVFIYVEPNSRKQGIGTALHNELEKFLIKKKPIFLRTSMRADIDNSSGFYKKLGFHKWWGSPLLYYDGERVPDSELAFSVYEDKYLDQFVKVNQKSYYPVQKSNDLKPYIPTKESIKKYKLQNKERVYLALNNGELMASVSVGEGEIDNLVVSPKYQGRGYGKKALQFGMNKLLEQGYEVIRICYMENNTVAENLYYSLGFKFLQNTHVYRKYL